MSVFNKLDLLFTKIISLFGETNTTMLLWNSNGNKLMYVYVGLEFCWSRAYRLPPLPLHPLLFCLSKFTWNLVWRSFRRYFYLDTMQIDLNATSHLIVSFWQIVQRAFNPKFVSPFASANLQNLLLMCSHIASKQKLSKFLLLIWLKMGNWNAIEGCSPGVICFSKELKVPFFNLKLLLDGQALILKNIIQRMTFLQASRAERLLIFSPLRADTHSPYYPTDSSHES